MCMMKKKKRKKKNIVVKMEPTVKVENLPEDCNLYFSLPASSLAKANKSADVAAVPGRKGKSFFWKREEGKEKTNLEIPL